ncbi:hypothetical protein [Dongia sp.]|uniref:hypothetical protein n=1 Tax=Dongia sp. TaxID=1977262 RepID=UPI003753C80E
MTGGAADERQGMWREYTLIYEECGRIRGKPQAQRTASDTVSISLRFAGARRSKHESRCSSEEIQQVVVLPRNRLNPAVLRWNNVLFFAHDDGGSQTGRVDRFVRGSHSRPTPRVESIVQSNAIGGTTADQKTAQQQTDKREKVRDERFGRSAMSPATTGGWIANFVDGVREDVTST